MNMEIIDHSTMKVALIAFITTTFGVIIDEKSLVPIGTAVGVCIFCAWIGFQYKGIKDEMKASRKRHRIIIRLISELHCVKSKILPKECICEMNEETTEDEEDPFYEKDS